MNAEKRRLKTVNFYFLFSVFYDFAKHAVLCMFREILLFWVYLTIWSKVGGLMSEGEGRGSKRHSDYVEAALQPRQNGTSAMSRWHSDRACVGLGVLRT